MGKLHKLTALSDELNRFFVATLTGKVHAASGRGQLEAFGSQQTPVSFGLSEGYSPQDIAHFYVARELGNRWIANILDNLDKPFRERLEHAFKEFVKDVRFEKQYVTKVMRQEVVLRENYS
jgi:hypothetical protein